MSAAALEKLIWVLIYAGLLTLGLGLFIERRHEPFGWTLMVGGCVVALAGFFLIFVRSRMKR